MSLLPAALPIVTWVAVTAGLVRPMRSLRQSLFVAALLMLGFVAASSELLSVFGLLRPRAIIALWLITSAGCCVWAAKSRSQLGARLCAWPRSAPYLVCYGVFALTLAVALAAPPNTWDGMTYHMSRVVHWLQNGSLQHYDTPISRQNAMPPLAEETILHFQALTASDRFANFPAWSYYCMSVLGVHLLARALQLRRMLVGVCTALSAVIPMAIFQATSCKNDAINTFLCVAFCVALTRLARTWAPSATLLAGLALGLGLYCKGTVLLVSGASGLAFALQALVRPPAGISRRRVFTQLAAIVAVGLVIAAPHAIRDRIHSHSHPEQKPTWTGLIGNEDYSPAAVGANVVRNAALHLALPSLAWNTGVYTAVTRLLGSEISNPKTTFMSSPFMVVYYPHEDYAGNPVHFVLGAVSLVVLAFLFRSLTPLQWFTATTVALAIVFFTVGLKWQPWMSRLHTPVFFLAVPLVGIVADRAVRWLSLGRRTAAVLCGVVVLCAGVSALPALLTRIFHEAGVFPAG